MGSSTDKVRRRPSTMSTQCLLGVFLTLLAGLSAAAEVEQVHIHHDGHRLPAYRARAAGPFRLFSFCTVDVVAQWAATPRHRSQRWPARAISAWPQYGSSRIRSKLKSVKLTAHLLI